MSTFNQDAWELISEWIQDHRLPTSSLWIAQPEPCPALREILKNAKAEILQDFKPYAEELKKLGSLVEKPSKTHPLSLLVPTRQKIESLGLIAQALKNLTDDGRLIFACANGQGAASFLSKLKELAPDLESDSGNKCKIAIVEKKQMIKTELLDEWIKEASVTRIEGSHFLTMPGIYGWNKVDEGSRKLVAQLPPLSGVGADFGSGYGFLSHEILASPQNSIEKIHLLEADRRALNCAQKNLDAWAEKIELHWVDISQSGEALAKIPPLDWIVMNPPFHEGRDQESRLGMAFIEAAAKKLKSGGKLFLVANAFLPYEDSLEKHFAKFRRIEQSEGFKVIHAER